MHTDDVQRILTIPWLLFVYLCSKRRRPVGLVGGRPQRPLPVLVTLQAAERAEAVGPFFCLVPWWKRLGDLRGEDDPVDPVVRSGLPSGPSAQVHTIIEYLLLHKTESKRYKI